MQNVLVSIESEHPVQILPVWGGLFVKYWLRLFDLIVNLSRFHKTQLQRGQILKPWQYLLGYETGSPFICSFSWKACSKHYVVSPERCCCKNWQHVLNPDDMGTANSECLP